MNLVNAQYCFLNQQCTKEAYETKVSALKLDTYDGIEKMKAWFAEFIERFPRVATEQYQSTNSTGDLIFRSERVNCSFDIQE